MLVGTVVITVLPKISTIGLTPKDANWLMENARNKMIDVFNRNNVEIEDKF